MRNGCSRVKNSGADERQVHITAVITFCSAKSVWPLVTSGVSPLMCPALDSASQCLLSRDLKQQASFSQHLQACAIVGATSGHRAHLSNVGA
jgi:hypothetical protein